MKFPFLMILALCTMAAKAQTNLDSLFHANKDYRNTIHSSYSQTYIVNSDIGDITFLDQGHPDGRQYVLNGNIIPYFAVTRRQSPFYVVLNPTVRVRIISNQFSLPVRTPSFQPGGTVFFNPFKHNIAHYKYFSVGVYHHSNGQDGDALNPDGSVNLKTGNFATNFITLNFFKGDFQGEANRYFKVGLELHSGLLKFGDEEKLRSKFGKVRINGQYAISKYHSSIIPSGIGAVKSTVTRTMKEKFLVDGMLVVDRIDATWNQHFNIEFKYYYNPFDFENTSFFASAGYMGHDYYNIYFVEPYPFVRIGFAAGLPLKSIEKAKIDLRDLR